MRPLVDLQVLASGERLHALVAEERLLARVNADVVGELVLGFERL